MASSAACADQCPDDDAVDDGVGQCIKAMGDLDIAAAQAVEASQISAVGTRLVVFDFDSTITISGDLATRGLSGERCKRLLRMAQRLRDVHARAILLTAQLPKVTRMYTIPLLETSGLASMFLDEGESDASASLCTYWQDGSRGAIYNGQMVMEDKLAVLRRIIDGENRWKSRFEPKDVFFIDDLPENLLGHGKLGIKVRLVKQDGMSEADIEAVEAFVSAPT